MRTTQNSSRAPRNSLRWKNGNMEEFVSPLNTPLDKFFRAVAFTLFLSGRTHPCSLQILFWSAIAEVKLGLKTTIVWISPHFHTFSACLPAPASPQQRLIRICPRPRLPRNSLSYCLQSLRLTQTEWVLGLHQHPRLQCLELDSAD